MGHARGSVRFFFGLITVFLLPAALTSAQVAITTYHYDNYRTGWNSQEKLLTPTSVASTSFGLVATVPLDDQVDAQPLLAPNVNITAGDHKGLHSVVYVATENNTVYAIAANNGALLLSRNLGAPVASPLNCNNNGPNVGVNSTPVLDVATNTLYVMTYTQQTTGRAYYLHALDLGSLTDKVPAQLVSASHTLSDGTTVTFRATYQRQRPGLLLANGNVYAGFGSFCDLAPSISRGWLLGWNATSLAPLAANQLLNTQPSSPNNYFLSSIWMSGYGLTADSAGNVLFVTGNSDISGTTYDGVTNLQESVVKLSPDLTTVLDLFTPSNQAHLDEIDADFGSGGVLVLPDQAGSVPHLAVAAGKQGTMFLMNEDNLGRYSTIKDNVLGKVSIGPCWCGQSYFVDSDGIGRVVSSGGKRIRVWKLRTSPTPALSNVTNSPFVGSGQTAGFFTSVSSNGSANPIIWMLSKPISATATSIFLYAFNPDSTGTTMAQLFKAVAGTWPSYKGSANLVPVVANGRVYVASNKELRIFGLK